MTRERTSRSLPLTRPAKEARIDTVHAEEQGNTIPDIDRLTLDTNVPWELWADTPGTKRDAIEG